MEFDFATNTNVVNIESVPEDFRGLYSQGEDGTYILNTTDPLTKSAVNAVVRINNALKASRLEVRNASSKAVDLSPLSDFGATPTEIATKFQTMLEEASVAGDTDMSTKISKIKDDLAKGSKAEIANRDKIIVQQDEQLFGLLGRLEGEKAFEKYHSVGSDICMPHLLPSLKTVRQEDGKLAVRVVDDAGDPRYSTAGGGFMTIDERVAEMKSIEKYGPLFKSEQRNGAGTPPGAGRIVSGTQHKESSDKKSPAQKISAGLESRISGK